VKVVAAEALATYGADSDLAPALAILGELAPPEKNGVFVAMAALNAIEALGPKATPLHAIVRAMKPQGASPDNRFDSYVPRQIASITGEPARPESSEGGKTKAKGKRKAAASANP
jgi:uncharacterized sulfatase